MTTLAAPPAKPENRPMPPATPAVPATPPEPVKPAKAPTPTSQDIKAIQDGLGRFMPLPWHEYDEITDLPPNGPEILEQAYKETAALPKLADPEQRQNQQESLDCLLTLRWTLEYSPYHPQAGYPLNTAQALLYRQAWENLEALRSAFAITMYDSLQPYIGVISDPELQSADLKPHKVLNSNPGTPAPPEPEKAMEQNPC